MPVVTQRAGSTQVHDDVSPRISAFCSHDISYHYFSGSTFESVVIARPPTRHAAELFLLALERLVFTSLAEASFAEDWDSDADAIYDGI